MIPRISVLLFCLLFSLSAFANSKNKAVSLTQDMIWNLHMGKSTSAIEAELSALDKEFFSQISIHSERQIFWINLYNAFMIQSVRQDSHVLHDNRFLSKRSFVVAGRKISLNDIEYIFLNRGIRPNGKDKLFVRKSFKSWMVEDVNHDIVYLLYRGYLEAPPIVHLDAANFNAMIKVLKWKFFEEQIDVARTTCTVPAFINDLSIVYFKDQEVLQLIRDKTLCASQAIIYTDKKTPALHHFYPRILP